MKRIPYAIAVLLILLIGSCGESPLLDKGKYRPNDLFVPPPTGGDERVDANGNELMLDDFLAIYHMPGDVDDLDPPVPTSGTLGRYAEDDSDPQRAGKYIVQGPVMGTSKLDSGGFTDVLFLYFKDPIEADFKMRARIRITANAGSSTSKGYHFGMYNAEEAIDFDGNPYIKFGQLTRGGGMIFRTNDTADNFPASAAVRPYFYTKNSAWGTGSNQSSGNPDWLNTRISSWKTELILELKRSADGITLTILNSKTGALYNTASPSTVAITDSDLFEGIRYGEKIYAGLALLGTSVEFSQFSIWLGPEDDPENNPQSPDNPANPPSYAMPETHPAYVPVDGVKIGISPAGNSTVDIPGVHPTRPNTGVYNTVMGNAATLHLVPVFEPVWADNTHVEWNVITWSGTAPAGGLNSMIVPVTGSNRVTFNPPGAGTALILMNSRDPSLDILSPLETLADWSLELTLTN